MTRNAAKFTLAHKMTKAVRELHPTADYRATFGACLWEINAAEKAHAEAGSPLSTTCSVTIYLDEAECGFADETWEAELLDCAIFEAAPAFSKWAA